MATAMPNFVSSSLSEDQEEALFEDFPKARYDKNPLESVLVEVRFPPILRIDSESPAKFQDALNGVFPLFKEVNPINFAPPEIAKMMQSANILPTSRAFNFSTSDDEWSVGLTRERLSLTCKSYTGWSNFNEKWEPVFQAFLSVYASKFFVRVGLRYRDIISREELGLAGVPWSELLSPGIISGVSHNNLESLLANSWHQVVFQLKKQNTQVLLQHGLQHVPTKGKQCYIFDTDFSTSANLEPQNVHAALWYFNKRSWFFFRSCITDKLHSAMSPHSI